MGLMDQANKRPTQLFSLCEETVQSQIHIVILLELKKGESSRSYYIVVLYTHLHCWKIEGYGASTVCIWSDNFILQRSS